MGEWVAEIIGQRGKGLGLRKRDCDRLSRVLKFAECGWPYTSAKCRYYLTILFMYAFHAVGSPIAMRSIIYGDSDSPRASGQTKLSPTTAATGKIWKKTITADLTLPLLVRKAAHVHRATWPPLHLGARSPCPADTGSCVGDCSCSCYCDSDALSFRHLKL